MALLGGGCQGGWGKASLEASLALTMYKLKYRDKALRNLKRIHPNDRERILEALSRLEKDPFSKFLDIRKLSEVKNSWRLRVGSTRALYELDKKEKVIYVWEVGYRGGIY